MKKEGDQVSDSEQLTVLRVLHHDQQAHKIILNEPLLQGLKETHSRDLIPIVHKLQEQFLILTNYLANFQNDILEGMYDDKKVLGKNLLSYVVKLSKDGALEEASNNCMKAEQKYDQAIFVSKELLRDLDVNLKFSTEYIEESPKRDVGFDFSSSISFTFINRNGGPNCENEAQMFDINTEKILQGLLTMLQFKISTLKKNPYYSTQ